jgi:hypothetical protein
MCPSALGQGLYGALWPPLPHAAYFITHLHNDLRSIVSGSSCRRSSQQGNMDESGYSDDDGLVHRLWLCFCLCPCAGNKLYVPPKAILVTDPSHCRPWMRPLAASRGTNLGHAPDDTGARAAGWAGTRSLRTTVLLATTLHTAPGPAAAGGRTQH